MIILKSFKFIDLFSGIGGFHQALMSLGGECVFASEIDRYAIDTYQKNYNINSAINIRDIDVENEQIPKHDVLCAGFPCQAFSKAGKQEGFNDETKGTLFFEIERILKKYHTKYIILENVRNLVSHDGGQTWSTIYAHLNKIGYRLTPKPLIVSPHQLGIPQLRERVVILGIYDPKNSDKNLNINFNDFNTSKDDNSIETILEEEPVDPKYYISKYEERMLTAWDEFYHGINKKIIGFPIWSEYFTKSFDDSMPEWKKEFIRKNNKLYLENKKFIDAWLKKYNNLEDFIPTHRKFEWQAGKDYDSVWQCIIQSRPSGVRVKKPTCSPALVAMVHVPIIGPRKRRLTIKEAAKLQSFPDSFIANDNDQQAYKQFGNAVNVDVIREAAKKLFNYKD